ncbi:hypothetical protein QBC32DRAFT_147331 [Pseudoneurospora amorphoporcata]|uniref:C2H2-type domain-containing protein n=1 Tax=Pseudoneurospora amorphoporcata TaxID=241081 RepID=A0AAN6NWA0_9PEZI|nr:hypothetical protein QBC32DRAFT_147331 [Pseudoneurospora amorphoporcata]
MEVHRKNWRCDMCDEIHYSSWNMKRHLTQKHSDIIKAENVEAHTQRLGRPPEKIGAEACLLYDYKGTLQRRSGSKPSDWELTPQAFGNHLANHLEELSLLVLPPTTANERKGKATTRLTDFNPSGTDMNSVVTEVDDKSELMRLQCPHCDCRPDGFNSVKGLGSHMVAIHRHKIKWVCSEPDLDSISDSVRPTKLLADCREFSSKKQLEWDWNACLQTLEGHSGDVGSVAFSPDGQRLASGSRDKAIKIWDLMSGSCL